VYGASDADITFSNSSGLGYLVAGSGNETLNGSNASGVLDLFGNVSSATLVGGSGADTLVAGSGTTSMTGGSGAANLFVFSNGSEGGTAYITDFGSAAGNMVGLFGYGATAAQTAIAGSIDNTTGGSVISLADNTTITFTNLTAAQLKMDSSQIFST
jgi:Ca2+-binding RTX toxin-like protein